LTLLASACLRARRRIDIPTRGFQRLEEENVMKDRRSFLKAAGAGVLSATAYQNVLGANKRVRVGFIGIGLIGKRHLLDFLAQSDVEAAAICEVYEPRLREGLRQ
jgi:hypothetical protein